MAYQYKAALARARAQDARWESHNFANTPLQDLYRNYRKVFLTLTHPAASKDLFLDLDAVRTTLPSSALSKTVSQWLAGLGNAALPTTNALPNVQERSAKFADIWTAGYNVTPVDRRRANNAELPESEKNDLLLTKPGVDFRSLWPYCMVTVNGLFHRIGGAAEGLFVVDGAKSGRIANNNHVGIYSFREVGKLDYVSINSSMLYKTHPNQSFANHVNIKLPYDCSNKTVLLVLGGYLHALDRAYVMTGPQSLKIDINNLNLVQRYYDSRNRIDLSRLALDSTDRNPDQIALDNIFNEETIRRYMTMTQSFLLIIDSPNVYVRRHDTEQTELPGRYLTEMPLQRFPLIGQYGRVFEYHAIAQDGQCVLACDTSRDDELSFETTGWRKERSLDDKLYSGDPWRFSRTQLLEIGIFN